MVRKTPVSSQKRNLKNGALNAGRPKLSPVIVPFLDPIDEICAQKPATLLDSTHYLVAALFALLLLIGAVVKIEVVVLGTGIITTEVPSIVVQPMDRSIIHDLLVRPGDRVRRGQVLATLDPTFTQAELVSITSQQRAVLATIQRIEAELNNTMLDFGSAPTAEEVLQASLYVQRRKQYATQLRVFDEDIERLKAAMQGNESDRMSYGRQFEIARELEKMRAILLQKEAGSRLQYFESQVARLRAERDFQDADNRQRELSLGVLAKRAERQVFIDDWRRQLVEGLVTARFDADRVGVGLAKATRMHDLINLTAPDDGVVVELAKRSVGSVLREAEPLITIVPASAPLIAEIAISSYDVGYTRPGDDVFVKVDAFPYQRHGTLRGKLLSVGEESLPSGSDGSAGVAASIGGRTAYHRARIRLLNTELEDMRTGANVTPGMTVLGEVKVGTRSALSYFLAPLTRGLRESLREP